MEYLVADARIPFSKKESFDAVVTPWLIDTLDMDLSDFLTVINYYLPIGGIFLNSGPLHFLYRGLDKFHQIDEIEELLKNSGFELISSSVDRVPYMDAPHMGSSRIEQVYSFKAKKVKNIELVKYSPLMNEPIWYLDHDSPISLPITEMNLPQAHKFNSEILSLVNNKRSLNEISNLVHKDHPQAPISEVKYLCAQIIKKSIIMTKNEIK
jgi:hypothetical protein